MIEPIIEIIGKDEEFELITAALKSLAPNSISFSFTHGDHRDVMIRPKFFQVARPRNLDNLTKAPHCIIYVFSCSNKTEYSNEYHIAVKEFYRSSTRPYINPFVVFINDAKKTKYKSLFSGFSGFITAIQDDAPCLQTVLLKPTGKLCKKDIRRIWDILAKEIPEAHGNRISFLSNMSETSPSLNSLRDYLDIIILYEQMGFYNKACDFSEKAISFIDHNPSLFKHIFSTKSLSYPLDFSISAENIEETLFSSDLVEYDFRYVLFKRQVQNLMLVGMSSIAIHFGWMFLHSIENRAKNNDVVSPIMFLLWLCKSLKDLVKACQKEIELGKKDIAAITISILNWYISELPHLRVLLFQESETESIDDPLNDQRVSSLLFPSFQKLCLNNELYNSEMYSSLRILYDLNRDNGFLRSAAIAGLQMQKFINGSQELSIDSAVRLISDGFGHLVPSMTESFINMIPYDHRILCCCHLLTNPNIRDHSIPASVLSKVLTDSNSRKYFLPFSLSLDVAYQGKPVFLQHDNVVLDFIYYTYMKSPITCNILKIIFLGNNNQKIIFSCENVELSNKKNLQFKGVFPETGTFHPILMQLCSGEALIQVSLPHQHSFIKVDPQPLALDFEIDMPGFLLPDNWQHALIVLNLTRNIDSLKIIVNGIQFRPSSLKLMNGGMIEPENGFIFKNVPIGNHTLYLPVFAHSSGDLLIEIEANNEKIRHSSSYNVSQYIDMKVFFWEKTGVAELTAFAKSPCEIMIKEVKFPMSTGEYYDVKSFGLPISLDLDKTSAIFVVGGKVDTADVVLQQRGLEPFSLRINVDILDLIRQDISQISPPITPFVPMDYKL